MKQLFLTFSTAISLTAYAQSSVSTGPQPILTRLTSALAAQNVPPNALQLADASWAAPGVTGSSAPAAATPTPTPTTPTPTTTTTTTTTTSILLMGLTTPQNDGNLQWANIQDAGNASQVGGNAAFLQFSDDTSSSYISFFKSRSSIKGLQKAARPGDDIGEVNFNASDGAHYQKNALINAVVDGPLSPGSIPSRLMGWTTNTSGRLLEAFRADSKQNLIVPSGKLQIGSLQSPLFPLTVVSQSPGTLVGAYYAGSVGGGAQIRASNGYSASVPVYAFWYNDDTGLGNPFSNVMSFIVAGHQIGTISSSGLAVTGAIKSSSRSGGLGYTAGAGGSVAQVTNKTESVTLNTATGQIAMSDATLPNGSTACFTLTDSIIGAYDSIAHSIASGASAGAYSLEIDRVVAGSARFCLYNHSGRNLSEAIVINFAVVKGAVD